MASVDREKGKAKQSSPVICDKKTPSDLRIKGLPHRSINFSAEPSSLKNHLGSQTTSSTLQSSADTISFKRTPPSQIQTLPVSPNRTPAVSSPASPRQAAGYFQLPKRHSLVQISQSPCGSNCASNMSAGPSNISQKSCKNGPQSPPQSPVYLDPGLLTPPSELHGSSEDSPFLPRKRRSSNTPFYKSLTPGETLLEDGSCCPDDIPKKHYDCKAGQNKVTTKPIVSRPTIEIQSAIKTRDKREISRKCSTTQCTPQSRLLPNLRAVAAPPVTLHDSVHAQEAACGSLNEMLWENHGSLIFDKPQVNQTPRRTPFLSPFCDPIPVNNINTAMETESTGSRSLPPSSREHRAKFAAWPWHSPKPNVPIVKIRTPSDENKEASEIRNANTPAYTFLAAAILRSREQEQRPRLRFQSQIQPIDRATSLRNSPKREQRLDESRAFPFPSPGESTMKPQNVSFFPPLKSRKTTNDWRSPLPDLNLQDSSPSCRTLYGQGLDMTLSGPRNIFSPSEERRNTEPDWKRSCTFDLPCREDKGRATSKKRPPSVCPLRGSPVAVEDVVDDEVGLTMFDTSALPTPLSTPPLSKAKLEERISLLASKTPQSPKYDHVGIYGRITGSKGSHDEVHCEAQKCNLHACGDSDVDGGNPSVDWIG